MCRSSTVAGGGNVSEKKASMLGRLFRKLGFRKSNSKPQGNWYYGEHVGGVKQEIKAF